MNHWKKTLGYLAATEAMVTIQDYPDSTFPAPELPGTSREGRTQYRRTIFFAVELGLAYITIEMHVRGHPWDGLRHTASVAVRVIAWCGKRVQRNSSGQGVEEAPKFLAPSTKTRQQPEKNSASQARNGW